LGYHNGIINYTIGQRKGLNIAFGERKFVVRIDAKNNKVILGNNDDLQSKKFSIKDIVFQKSNSIVDAYNTEKEVIVKLRYRHDGTSCKLIEEKDGQVDFILDDDVRAITAGQTAVFYNGKNEVLYGGTII
ncbi:MAG: tRNA 2-thiouridine(34) synthase MnmA, partial [Lachnospiraceae bacterium]|nr:tRNA 2-thiouridine(34) synthase MnmA [Lachnospiraceae bacterium]